ncbi:MAG: N-acetyltransferase family protein [Chloroflexota bacterium]
MLTIRNAAPEDARAVVELLGRVWKDDYVPEAWAAWMEDDRDIKLIAELDGQIAGLCRVGHVTSDECWFCGMRVDPAFHRRGIGTALTRAAIAAARERGYDHAWLGIDTDNTASLAMTARTGFTKIYEYVRLSGATVAGATGPRLRAATIDDVPRLMAIARETVKRDGVPAATFWGWEWSTLTEEALRKMAAAGECFVIDRDPLDAYLAASVGDADVDCFNPYGPVPAVVELVSGLIAQLAERNLPVNVFVPLGSPYLAPLTELGLQPARGDGYTIWHLDLKS